LDRRLAHPLISPSVVHRADQLRLVCPVGLHFDPLRQSLKRQTALGARTTTDPPYEEDATPPASTATPAIRHFTVAEPGTRSTVSLVIQLYSSRSRRTTRSAGVNRIRRAP
jgi:hypothetical protein